MRYHVTWFTYGSWLPGDPRGFRTRHHRMHVEGDYENPPPSGVYDGLHRYALGQMYGSAVILPALLREIAGRSVIEQFAADSLQVHAISVGGQHVHVALEGHCETMKQAVGRAKRVSSHRIRLQLPGQVWAEGCHVTTARNDLHWQNVLRYVQEQEGNPWVWTAGKDAGCP